MKLNAEQKVHGSVCVDWARATRDGSHKKTTDEKEGEVYLYDADGTRTEIAYIYNKNGIRKEVK